MMVVVFIVNAIQTKVVRTKMEQENDKTQRAIQEHIPPEVYDQVAKDQIEFRELRNKARDAEFSGEQPVEEKPAEIETESENQEEKNKDDLNV